MEERKPTYGKRKLMNNAIVLAMFSLVKKEIEESDEEGLRELYVAAFR